MLLLGSGLLYTRGVGCRGSGAVRQGVGLCGGSAAATLRPGAPRGRLCVGWPPRGGGGRPLYFYAPVTGMVDSGALTLACSSCHWWWRCRSAPGSLPAVLSARLMHYGGRISFSLYMIHEPVHGVGLGGAAAFSDRVDDGAGQTRVHRFGRGSLRCGDVALPPGGGTRQKWMPHGQHPRCSRAGSGQAAGPSRGRRKRGPVRLPAARAGRS